MSFKDTFKENLTHKRELAEFRYGAAKGVFIFVSFFFFCCFFMVGAGYYSDTMLQFLSPLYVMMVLSFSLYIYFLTVSSSENKVYYYSALGLCSIFLVAALILVI